MDEKKGIAPDLSPDTGALPRVIRQLLRTPAFKDLLIMSMKDANPEDPRDLAKTLLWEDSALSFGALGSLPLDLNFMTAFLQELGLQLQNVPPEMFREFVGGMGEKIDKESLAALPSAYTPLIKTLLWEDPEACYNLRKGACETINSFLNLSVKALNESRNVLEENNGLLTAGDLDPEALANFITGLFKLIGETAGKDPETIEAMTAKKIAFSREFLRKTDFGVIRSSLVKKTEAEYPVSESVIAFMASDPLIFANLFSLLPPLLNNVLKGTATAINNLDFPAEILASAIFNFLEDLDGDAVCNIINGLGIFINGLHEGNLILGRDEPRFRPVLQRFMSKSFTDVDEEELASAMLALFEDSEVIFNVCADFLLQKPKMAEEFFPAFLEGVNAQLRGLNYFADKLNQFSPQLYGQFARELEDVPAYGEAAALINSLIKLTNTVLAENPDLLENVFKAFYSSLNKEDIQLLANTCATGAYNFAVSEKVFAGTPAYAGRKVNELLVSYNNKLESEPDKVQEVFSSYFKEINYEQLAQAIGGTMKLITEAIKANPQFSKALMKSIVNFASGLIKTSITPISWNMSLRSDKNRGRKERWKN